MMGYKEMICQKKQDIGIMGFWEKVGSLKHTDSLVSQTHL